VSPDRRRPLAEPRPALVVHPARLLAMDPDGKHTPIIDADLFDQAQKLLAERAAESATVAATLSEYLLSGKLRCRACGGAYVGAGAHGRNGSYRYYVCRTRQAKGARASPGRRIVADQLEAAIIGQLSDLFTHSELFEQAALGAFAEVADQRPQLEAEYVSTDTQLNETITALNRYLYAFETGAMPAEVCAPRVSELSARRDELTIHHKRLAAELRSATPRLPGHDELARLVAKINQAVNTHSPDVVKQMFEELIARVEITPDRHAHPYFYVPDMNKPGPLRARACNTTPVRMGSHHVEVAGIEPASFSTSPGLLRVQPALLFSAPAVTQASCRRAQSLLAVPSDPATGPEGRSSLLMPDTGPEELPG